MKWAGYDNDKLYVQNFVKSEGKKPLGKPRCREEHNNKMHFK
jgi:hypothetical protein